MTVGGGDGCPTSNEWKEFHVDKVFPAERRGEVVVRVVRRQAPAVVVEMEWLVALMADLVMVGKGLGVVVFFGWDAGWDRMRVLTSLAAHGETARMGCAAQRGGGSSGWLGLGCRRWDFSAAT